MSVNCIDDEGVDDYVLITMFGAPWVDYGIDDLPNGERVHPPYSYGYHSAYTVTSRLTVNNQNNQAYYATLFNRDVELGLFSWKGAKRPFHSDVFTINKAVVNETRQPVLYHTFLCEDAAGKTLAVEVFSLTNPESIYLLEDQLIIK
ncbi:hypothetical protein [Pseudoalteromonas aurantia]|uniref:Uncharacterized protein n=1 Tax=Pseudoalteromonas aurantia TaxID=43654 RepID=A0ABY2W210_9GAMM|nr:hypothetical protein [Pseudoalteromonas aurantia]TMO78234.1 hypothetical protein CWC20_02395 [Pseudoalteromonas aurantia]